MNLLAVIAEYNPFHQGHRWQLEEARRRTEATHTLALMSGAVVQRGAFALADKWTRAKAAVLGGADLVCELPYVYAGQSAEFFASGAIKILNATGCCDHLVFGSESGDLESLSEIAEILALETPAFRADLKAGLSRGLSFPKARAAALQKQLTQPLEALLTAPNNILAIEYLKALKKSQSAIAPITLRRQGAAYHADTLSDGDGFASATQLRGLLTPGNIPETQRALAVLKKQLPYPAELLTEALAHLSPDRDISLYKTLIHRLLITPPEQLRQLPYWEPGLEFALKALPECCATLEDLIDALTAKHLPRSRVRRLLMALAADFKAEALRAFQAPDFTPYLRVLAFNSRGQEILRAIKKQEGLPILTNLHSNQTLLTPAQRRCLAWDVLTTDLFSLHCEKKYTHHRDYLQGPVRVI
ncbi:MAG: nucleotidyltransferase family protein [Eubacterium sp.]|nr:nucleotidyltransferase family protein [Eubacterium sp.]